MPMPEGIVTQRIARVDGCPARAGQPDTFFEVFQEGRLPECETAIDSPDIFNTMDELDEPAFEGDLFGGGEEESGEPEEQPDETAEDEEEDEELF